MGTTDPRESGNPAVRGNESSNVAPRTNPDDQSGGGGGGVGGGGGYGAWSAAGNNGPTRAQKDAARALEPIALYNQNTLLNKADQARDVYDIGDQGSKNLRDYQAANAQRSAGAEWFSNLLKEQSTTKLQRDKMGNARYGSGALDLMRDMERAHDATAATILETLENNLASIDTDYYQALQASINGWNENAMDTEAKLRELFSDYAAQINNIHPDIATGRVNEGYDEPLDEDEDEYGYEFPKVIDIENRELLPPEWFKPDYYEANKRGAVVPQWMLHIRPDAATETSWKRKQNPGQQNTSSAANKRYWQALTTSYGNRPK